MKNLKRALSLVLSAAMMVGMMAIGTSAAFADVDSSDNLEAISVMEMIGVMEGDGTNFNPDRVVTRNEMAVVICNLMNRVKFSSVKANHFPILQVNGRQKLHLFRPPKFFKICNPVSPLFSGWN